MRVRQARASPPRSPDFTDTRHEPGASRLRLASVQARSTNELNPNFKRLSTTSALQWRYQAQQCLKAIQGVAERKRSPSAISWGYHNELTSLAFGLRCLPRPCGQF